MVGGRLDVDGLMMVMGTGREMLGKMLRNVVMEVVGASMTH